MSEDELNKEIIETIHRLWFCDRMIFILKKRRASCCFIEFFYFLANLIFLTIGIIGIGKVTNHSCNGLEVSAFIISFIIGAGMLLISTADHFLLRDLGRSMRKDGVSDE